MKPWDVLRDGWAFWPQKWGASMWTQKAHLWFFSPGQFWHIFYSADNWVIPVIKNAPKILSIFDIEIESDGLFFHIRLQPINGPF